MLKIDAVVSGYGGPDIVQNVSFHVAPNEFLCILGANGCGKSTLLKTILGLIRPRSGRVLFCERDIHKMSERELARAIAYIPQSHLPPFPFTVADVVLMGRSPYLGRMSGLSQKDVDIAWSAMEQLGIADYAYKNYTELSGGQRQMVIIARALAQQTKIMVMDEPTASLDFGNQYIVLEQMARLSKSGLSVLMVSHNPDHALYCCDKVIAMQKGRILGEGIPGDIIDSAMMQRIYKTRVEIAQVNIPGRGSTAVCVPVGGR